MHDALSNFLKLKPGYSVKVFIEAGHMFSDNMRSSLLRTECLLSESKPM